MTKMVLGAIVILGFIAYGSYGIVNKLGPGYRVVSAAGMTNGKTGSDLRPQPGSRNTIAYPRSVTRYTQLKDLCDHSSEIFVGVAVGKKTYQESGPGSMVFTNYDIKVLQTIKGDQHPARHVTLQTPGGSVAVGGGPVTEIRMPDFWKNPEIGQGYVFFVTKKKDGPARLVGGPQGLFSISPSTGNSTAKAADFSTGLISPNVLESDEFMQKYDRTQLDSFLNEVRQFIAPRSRLQK